MALARRLRHSRVLQWLYTWIFERTVPLLFALALVVFGLLVANRVLFDVVSASGHFCKASVPRDARDKERVEASAKEFRTDEICWASGFVLEKGRRYRITLTTPGDWLDHTVRTDVAGFPAENARFLAATLLKRWWTANWFKPIARLGEIGNDEYALDPVDDFEEYTYPPCPSVANTSSGKSAREKISEDAARGLIACAPTPDGRRTVVTDIKARTTEELFVYVNDAVVMWPGSTGLFYGNNRGTGVVTVKRLTDPSTVSR
jgi:hypothetical protein